MKRGVRVALYGIGECLRIGPGSRIEARVSFAMATDLRFGKLVSVVIHAARPCAAPYSYTLS